MDKNKRLPFFFIAISLLVLLSCNALTLGTPTPDLLATLQASTPLAQTQQAIFGTVTPSFPTPVAGGPTPTFNPSGGPTPTVNPGSGPAGKIVFTCQVYKVQSSNQVCQFG